MRDQRKQATAARNLEIERRIEVVPLADMPARQADAAKGRRASLEDLYLAWAAASTRTR